ncbi:hypothetical protein B484DRAFT_409174 [Ochromonadaceae sp. CCMP2298]|nr:hypothetical protein B484DRAFT_409174 [Ochromonadaceae sp. CCMP2298]
MLDEFLIPHLLEVNVSPSLVGSSPLDFKVKGAVVADTLHVVGTYLHDELLLRKYDVNIPSARVPVSGQTLPTPQTRVRAKIRTLVL